MDFVSVYAYFHLTLSIFLIVLVLIQDPKGGGAGGMFGGGGGSNSLFGATGAPTFLARVTRWVAGLFALSCIWMTISIKPASKSVLDDMNIPAASSTETAPGESKNPAAPAEETAPAEESQPAETK